MTWGCSFYFCYISGVFFRGNFILNGKFSFFINVTGQIFEELWTLSDSTEWMFLCLRAWSWNLRQERWCFHKDSFPTVSGRAPAPERKQLGNLFGPFLFWMRAEEGGPTLLAQRAWTRRGCGNDSILLHKTPNVVILNQLHFKLSMKFKVISFPQLF